MAERGALVRIGRPPPESWRPCRTDQCETLLVAGLRRDLQVVLHALHTISLLGNRRGAGTAGFRSHDAIDRDSALADVEVDVAVIERVLGDVLRIDLRLDPTVGNRPSGRP